MADWVSEFDILADVRANSKNQPQFSSPGSQESWMLGKSIHSNYTYTPLTCETPLKIGLDYDKFAKADMVTWVNRNNSSQRYYADIVSRDWLNNNVAILNLKLNSYQTYQHATSLLDCYVSREHIKVDWNGSTSTFDYNAPEMAGLGSHVTSPSTVVTKFYDSFQYVVASATDPSGNTNSGSLYGKIYSGLEFRSFSSPAGIDSYLTQFATQGNLDSVVAVFQMPIGIGSAGHSEQLSITIPSGRNINGYATKHSKTSCYPYRYLEARSSDGAYAQFKLEDFDQIRAGGSTINFALNYPVQSLEPSIYLVPLNYKNERIAWNDAICLSVAIPCAWTGNVFANWMGGNFYKNVAQVTGLTGRSIQTLWQGGDPYSNIANGSMGLLGGLGSMGARILDEQASPVKYMGGTSVNASISAGRFGFELRMMELTAKDAERVDNYFNAFGYSCGLTKTPELYTRPFWNYVQTVGCAVIGSMPQPAKDEIASMFNSGVTLWHVDKGAQIGNYAMDNSA